MEASVVSLFCVGVVSFEEIDVVIDKLVDNGVSFGGEACTRPGKLPAVN